MSQKTPDFPEGKIKNLKSKYEVFEVDDELIFSDDREKIKEYAKSKEIKNIVYKMSVDSKEKAKNIAKEI